LADLDEKSTASPRSESRESKGSTLFVKESNGTGYQRGPHRDWKEGVGTIVKVRGPEEKTWDTRFLRTNGRGEKKLKRNRDRNWATAQKF